MNKQHSLPELLAPAGDFEKLTYALAYGADAVYFAGKRFGLRAKSTNFDDEQLKKAIAYTHEKGKKAYITVNVFARNDDIKALPGYLSFLNDLKPDGLLISDPGVFSLAQKYAPDISIHISTQANNVNYASADFWQRLGASRIVLGRELSLEEIREIRLKTDMELELFCHGAMCMSYSGRCLLSNFLTGKDANRGECTHPCRWEYALTEASRPGQYFPIEEDEHGSYIMNSKDLNLLPLLPQLTEMGIDSLKIEGRIKSLYYVAVVVSVYRKALDCLKNNPEIFAEMLPCWQQQLSSVSHREYTLGFLKGALTGEDHRYHSTGYERGYDFIGIVTDAREESSVVQDNMIYVEQRNHFALGEDIEFMTPEGDIIPYKLQKMLDEENSEITVAPHAQMKVKLPSAFLPDNNTIIPPMSIMRRKVL